MNNENLGERYKIIKTRDAKGRQRKQKVCAGRASTKDCRKDSEYCVVFVSIVLFYAMHAQAATNLECNNCWGWPDGHCDVCTWERHSSRRCIDAFIKEKEYSLGIDSNPSAPVMPAGCFLKRFDPTIPPFAKTGHNTEKIPNKTEKEPQDRKISQEQENQWKTVKGSPNMQHAIIEKKDNQNTNRHKAL